MSLNAFKKIIKITILSALILTKASASTENETDGFELRISHPCTCELNPNAIEFIPTSPASSVVTSVESWSEDETFDPRDTDSTWVYANWSYPIWSYPQDFKATKGIKKRLRELNAALALANPTAIAGAYLNLGNAHLNHMGDRQAYYYNMAYAIGQSINDLKIMEKSYIALGNKAYTEFDLLEAFVWYHEAFKLQNSKHIKKIHKNKIKELKRQLIRHKKESLLDAYQQEAIKVMAPHLLRFVKI